MASISRCISVVSTAVILYDLPVLLRVAKLRCIGVQLRYALLLFLLRRGAEAFLPRKMLMQIQDFLSQPSRAIAFDAVVPLSLAASGMQHLFSVHEPWRLRLLKRVLVIGSVPTLVDAVEERFGEEVDLIAVLALELGLIMGQWAASAVILLMLTGGEALEHYAFARARLSLKHILDESVPTARRLANPCINFRQIDSDGTSDNHGRRGLSLHLEDVKVEAIRCGDVIAIRAGEAVPVDGHVWGVGENSQSVVTVDESLLTGETGETVKNVGDTVLSGSIAQKPLWLQTTAPFEGSTMELMRQALQDALERKANIQHQSAKAAELLQPLTLAAAGLSLLVRRRSDSIRRWKVLLSVLMAATPCPASIGVPVAFLSGMSVAARHSVLIKSGAAVEFIAKATHVVLDKTGTLTHGAPTVKLFERFQSGDEHTWPRRAALQLVASIEVFSTHPLAAAIRRYAESENIELLRAENCEYLSGCGMMGNVADYHVVIGTRDFLSAQGVKDITTVDRTTTGESGLLEAFYSINQICAGRITFEDSMRSGTKAALQKLAELGLQVSILSGDHSGHLAVCAKNLGIKDARGGCLPHEKAKHIEHLAKAGCVIMVGDEGNDAPAFAAAHVGIAVGTRSGLASESADVVVSAFGTASPLTRVAQLVVLCRHVCSTAKRGVQCGLGISAIQVAAAAAGLIHPRTNAVLQELVDVSALINAASVLRYRWS